MCPACLASAAVVVGSVTTTGGVTALAVKLFRGKKNEHGSKNTDAKNTERRDDDGDSNK